ncbi:hypothetical protein AWB99_16990 [Mycolicibacterium confluentis]|uniref:Uncharacterized protein n=1 Tax=Mycolicibacterium confluentis TaxID=28047 RepID=A0A7I7Y4M5_9MYCO|nr:hypothetical protein [Mycolicibacterium confluentis]ORV28808.1 hypothetical protein AWB99_16990 [Mycolicibacterium confluentis]BBZ36579.1 hypothetical protein MCNF_51840 [Mycolicibacterium confluentis]
MLSASHPGSSGLQLDKVKEHFAARCRSIHLIPFDPHLAEGGEVDIELRKPATHSAYVDLAAGCSGRPTPWCW